VIILLDTGVLGLIINTKPSEKNKDEVIQCNKWMENLLQKKHRVIISEIADYEQRRELILNKNLNGIQRLNALVSGLDYFRITTNTMHKAAELWAFARKEGKQTSSNKALDGDAILCSQAILTKKEGINVIVATTDTADLNRLLKKYHIEARQWRHILP